MAVVTVDEAALRLRAAATVRRRLGPDIARHQGWSRLDVHVSGLPAPGATTRKVRSAAFSDEELETANPYVSNFDLTYLWVPM